MVQGFTGDPGKIREVGHNDLPALADGLLDIRDRINYSEDLWAKAFREDRKPLGSLYSDTEWQWRLACEMLVNRIEESQERIRRAGEALVAIADNYTATDDALAGMFVLFDEELDS